MTEQSRPMRQEIPRRTFIIGVAAAAVGFSVLGWFDEYAPCVNPFADLG